MAQRGQTLGQQTQRAQLPPKKGAKRSDVCAAESGTRRLMVSCGVSRVRRASAGPAGPKSCREGRSAGLPCQRPVSFPFSTDGFPFCSGRCHEARSVTAPGAASSGTLANGRLSAGPAVKGPRVASAPLHPHWRFSHKQRRGAASSCPHSPLSAQRPVARWWAPPGHTRPHVADTCRVALPRCVHLHTARGSCPPGQLLACGSSRSSRPGEAL